MINEFILLINRMIYFVKYYYMCFLKVGMLFYKVIVYFQFIGDILIKSIIYLVYLYHIHCIKSCKCMHFIWAHIKQQFNKLNDMVQNIDFLV